MLTFYLMLGSYFLRGMNLLRIYTIYCIVENTRNGTGGTRDLFHRLYKCYTRCSINEYSNLNVLYIFA